MCHSATRRPRADSSWLLQQRPGRICCLCKSLLGSFAWDLGTGQCRSRDWLAFGHPPEPCVPLSPEHCSAPRGCFLSWRGGILLKPCSASISGFLMKHRGGDGAPAEAVLGYCPSPRAGGWTAHTFALGGTNLSINPCALLARDWMWTAKRRFRLAHSALMCGKHPYRPSCLR